MDNSNLIKEIKNLKKEIKPRQEWVNLSRDILLQQIDPRHEYNLSRVGLSGYVHIFSQIFRQRLLEPAIVMLLVLGVFLGSSLTINAAFYSLPGDGLYPIKIALEKAHVALVPNEENQVELQIEFAQKRVAEFGKIVQSVEVDPAVKKKKIEIVIKELKNNAVAVSSQLEKIDQETGSSNVNESDRQMKVRIATNISSQTEKLVKSVEETVGSLSEAEQSGLEEIVADAVEAVQGTNNSAKLLVGEEVDEETSEDATNTEEAIGDSTEEATEEDGVVQGAATEEETSSTSEDQDTEPSDVPTSETVEPETAEEEEEIVE